MKKIFTLVAAFGFLMFFSCQTDKKNPSETKSITEPQAQDQSSTISENTNREKPAPYNDWGNYILSYLKVDTIPESFPKYHGQGKEAYRKEGMKWAKENLDLIKETKRNEIKNYEFD